MKSSIAAGMLDTFGLIILTGCYLIFELGFNARLLDVVGGTATPEQVEAIEKYGRTLSGIAVALVAFQISLRYRRKALEQSKTPRSLTSIFILCALTIVVVFFGIRTLVDYFVETSTPDFRRLSLNLVLLQRALVEDKAELGDLGGGHDLLSKPEGKAFLALFPAMASSVSRVDEKIHKVKFGLLQDAMGHRLGRAKGFYEGPYRKAMNEVIGKWKKYSDFPEEIDSDIRQKQDKAWQDYLHKLNRRGWTPYTVPGYARSRVVQDVRKRVSVPRNWNLTDEATFRKSVERKTLAAMGRDRSGNVIYKGDSIPPGLPFNQFLLQPPVQRELKEKLSVSATITVRADYASSDHFKSALYDPMLKDKANKELKKYEAPIEDFRDGEKYAKQGLEAARSAIVPPIALLFSLAGAIGHSGKLLYLLVKMLSQQLHRMKKLSWEKYTRLIAFATLALTLSGAWITLSIIENGVTTSKLYIYMAGQMEQVPEGASFKKKALAAVGPNIMHVVAVGQGFGYPINEYIRKNWLKEFDYGYVPVSN